MIKKGRIFITPNNSYSVFLKKNILVKKSRHKELPNFPFQQGMLFPLLVNLKLEEFSNSEELNMETNKCLSLGVITAFFQGLLPI